MLPEGRSGRSSGHGGTSLSANVLGLRRSESVVTASAQSGSREATAVHEAGHAVASYRLGFSQQLVSIVPRPGTDGHMTDDDTHAIDFEGDRVKTDRETAEDAAVVLYAGLAAEAHFGFARYVWPRTPHPAWSDSVQARTRLVETFGNTREIRLAVARCRRRAIGVIRRHEADVRKVADALSEVGTLTEGEIEAILEIRSVAAADGAETLLAKRIALDRRRERSRGPS